MSSGLAGSGKQDAIGILVDEIEKARDDRRPTSRHMLAEIIHERTLIPMTDALAMVDAYCEEKEPAIPDYLQEEFAIPYLKFIAIVIVILGMGFVWYGVQQRNLGRVPQTWWALGALVMGIGVFAYVQSLEKFVARRKQRRGA